jgi:hypothetical protein
MAITQVPVATPATLFEYTNTSIANAAVAVKASSTLAYWISVDNSANSGGPTYVKLYNLAQGSVTVGTTAPDAIIYVPASSICTQAFYTSSAPGLTFGTALTVAAVNSGGTAGTTSPSSSVVLTIVYV